MSRVLEEYIASTFRVEEQTMIKQQKEAVSMLSSECTASQPRWQFTAVQISNPGNY
jgi:hypothetical protein